MRRRGRRSSFLAASAFLFLAALIACGSFSGTDDQGSSDAGDERVATKDSAVVLDGSTSADAADSAVPDAAPPKFSLACGANFTCTTLRDGCCYEPSKDAGDPFSCAPAANICPQTPDVRRYLCDDQADCAALGTPGLICCGKLVNPSGGPHHLETATCIAPASCTGFGRVVRCDPAVLTGQCEGGKQCKSLEAYPAASGSAPIPVKPAFFACLNP